MNADVVVIGAGFGGLGAALALAEQGARVVVFESLRYPGGCASTFEHQGYRFEAGATLFSGLADDQLFGRWIERHRLDVDIDWLDPVIELRTPEWRLAIPPDRERFVERVIQLPGAPVEALRRFFEHQRRVADRLWGLLSSPALWPPFGLRAGLHHGRRLPAYARLLRDIGRPLPRVLARYGLEGWAPLRTLLDAVCQITLQCSAAEAEALFALGALDYCFRGTGHVRGGIGRLAWGLVAAIEQLGGSVRFTDRVRHCRRHGGVWHLETRRTTLRAPVVVANLLPADLGRLLDASTDRADRLLARRAADVASGWGACMLYRAVVPPEVEIPARHLELVQEPSQPLIEGNHLFCSISSPLDHPSGSADRRTMTVSTHVAMAPLLALPEERRGQLVATIQDRMRRGLARLAPEWADVMFEATASPRTFERFTGRGGGYVGGVPRRAGLVPYLDLMPKAVLPGLHLVGDSVFPGQSTLATALGGVKLAERLAASRGPW